MADEKHFKLEMCNVEAGKTAEGEYQLGNKMMDLVQARLSSYMDGNFKYSGDSK